MVDLQQIHTTTDQFTGSIIVKRVPKGHFSLTKTASTVHIH